MFQITHYKYISNNSLQIHLDANKMYFLHQSVAGKCPRCKCVIWKVIKLTGDTLMDPGKFYTRQAQPVCQSGMRLGTPRNPWGHGHSG